ncbi:hypothetical protein PanWU01x14_099430 [Parasponia andersonii]|uniref:Uncharacterized protein n=1 Tax=Parasponia andersonii TaxID=3476 RepID=A0A2P5D3S3_PARAD|nr:hypothetical protein PanWU01x14_099430 [Parasponia andersonii]
MVTKGHLWDVELISLEKEAVLDVIITSRFMVHTFVPNGVKISFTSIEFRKNLEIKDFSKKNNQKGTIVVEGISNLILLLRLVTKDKGEMLEE